MKSAMKAITVYGPGDMRIEDVPLRPLKKDEVLVRVAWTGICATDLSIYTGESSFIKSGEIRYPCRIGHEWSGIVEEVGESVTKFKKGDRVITDNGVSCGECDNCRCGDRFACTEIMSVGTINCWDGCYAEYMYMPECHTYPLADSVSLEEAALAEPLSIALGAVKKYEIRPETTVAVIGTGSIALGAAALASVKGAKQVVVIGRKDFKLQAALKCGATHIINSTRENAQERLREITGGKGADYVIEASGGPTTVEDAMRLAVRRGTVALLAFYERTLDAFPIDTLVSKELTVKGVMGGFGLVPEAAEYLAKGLPVEGMVTHRIEFSEVPAFFARAAETGGERIKALVRICP